jgi:hypothetical protein
MALAFLARNAAARTMALGVSGVQDLHDDLPIFSRNMTASQTVEVDIIWPNGGTQGTSSAEINRYHRIVAQVTK